MFLNVSSLFPFSKTTWLQQSRMHDLEGNLNTLLETSLFTRRRVEFPLLTEYSLVSKFQWFLLQNPLMGKDSCNRSKGKEDYLFIISGSESQFEFGPFVVITFGHWQLGLSLPGLSASLESQVGEAHNRISDTLEKAALYNCYWVQRNERFRKNFLSLFIQDMFLYLLIIFLFFNK